MHYVTGDKVEVLNNTLENSWYPAQIVEGDGDVYTVLYDGHVYGMKVEVVLVKYIRPRPPVVEFSNWNRGDLVHVFDNFAWKLATVLQVLEKKQFMVRVIGSMVDLNVDAARVRVRHYWNDDQWTVVGKGPSTSDVKRQFTRCKLITNSKVQQSKTNVLAAKRTARHKSDNMPTKAIKMKNASSTLDQTQARGKPAKLSRTIERSSHCTLNQTEACTNTGLRSRLTEELQVRSGPPATNATLKEAHEKHEDSGLTSVGSCSINTDSSSYQYPTPTKRAEHGFCNESDMDAESCNMATSKPGKHTRIVFSHKGRKAASLDRGVQQSKLVLRFRLQGCGNTAANQLPLPLHTPDDIVRRINR